MGNVHALGYLGLGVRDLGAWEHYATDILGMQAEHTDSDGTPTLLLRMDERRYRLALTAGEDELTYVGWEVAGPDELDAVVRTLDAAGVAHKEDAALAELRGVRRLVSCTDPAGVTLEFHYGATAPKLPFVSPTGATFVTTTPDGRDLGLGHVVVTCADPDTAIAFYRDVLGFKISDYIVPIPGLVLTFLHVNPRHHSLAVAPNRPGADTKTEINHFMIEVADVDTVGRALDKVHAQKIQKLATLGRHTNDKMLSFYMHSPSGFGVEYGTQGLLIDDDNWSVVTYDAAAYWGHEFDQD
ncbi:VOC family protein [Amycolatopsis sp. GM8]|uniref:VOC family protein n=1 Tax=Amycolatopsis sp. GM8 TaxID=2896530 RepID=UPI001F2A3C8A|nr:VOC family protein [Amycolatopsis sp. GM8]